MTDTIRVVWMDDQIQTYEGVESAAADDRGQLVLSGPIRPSGGGRKRRTIRIPLANVRWWGTPGETVGW